MRRSRLTVLALFASLIAIPAIPLPAEAQIGQRIRDRARQQVEQRVEQRAEQAVDRALDATESALSCVVTDQECIRAAHAEGREVALTDEHGAAVARADYPAAALRPGEGAWANYDFVPGERVIFAEDFTRDNVGDFPRRLEFQRGNMEVVEWQGERWLRTTGGANFAIVLPETLPQRFTLEFDYAGSINPNYIYLTDDTRRPNIDFGWRRGGIRGGPEAVGQVDRPGERGHTVRVMADGAHVKVYLGETRVANVPNADLGRSDRLHVRFTGSTQTPGMITNLRIAAGGRTLYDALAADGRVVTRGILFDTGSDRIRPESTPTLKEIGEMLGQHADLRLRIEGHTDSVGAADANQALSERRAQSVMRYLVEHHRVEQARLEAAGLGESRPVDSNDTPEGRQNNRRVELVRL
jgi:OmpA-OmpF porin, OOP family